MIRYTFLTYICLLWLSLHWTGLNAQNPFDLEHRLEQSKVEFTPPVNPGNPFEINRSVEVVKPSPAPITEPATKITPASSPAGPFKFWLITASLVLLTLLLTFFKSLVVNIYRAFINDNFLKLIHRNEGRIVSAPYLLLYALALLNMGIFIYLLSDHFGWLNFGSPAEQFFACLAGVIAVYLVKHCLLMLVGGIFPIDKDLRQYSFTIVVFNIMLGIVLVPFNLVIAFTAFDLARVLIYIALSLIAILFLYRSVRGLFISANYLALHKFHFFMYLCTVELAPLAILIKLISQFSGLYSIN